MPYKDKEKAKEWQRSYYKTEEQKIKRRKWYWINREKLLLDKKMWRKTEAGKAAMKINYIKKLTIESVKYRARYIVRNAIRREEIFKSTCLNCGNNKAEAHHEDYFKPLEIIWLCRKCHCEYHRKIGTKYQ